MSHYIQDNQIVVKTADNKILLFIKGGDNNCFSYDNKRVTSWHLNNSFSCEEAYNAYITEILMSDISGGSWQFASLKNRSFNGYTQYENIIYNRFEKAFNNAIYTTWKVSDLNVNNIYEFESSLMSLFREKKVSLKDETGCENGLGFIWSYTDDITKEESAINRLNKSNGYKQKDGSKEYREFCKRYANKSLEELINDVKFCSDVIKFDKSYNKSISVLEKLTDVIITNEVDFACFNILVNSNDRTVEDLLHSYYMKTLLEDYPEQFETLNCLDSFHLKAKSILELELQKENDYMYKKYKDNYNLIVNSNYLELKDKKRSKIQEIKSSAKDKFIDIWNGLIDDCWFKTTNERLPRKVKELNAALDTNTFSLDEIKLQCNNNFTEIITKYQHQQKKNQPVIKKIFKDLINEYYLLFDKSSVDELCSYFGYEIFSKDIKNEKQIITVKINEPEEFTKLTQLSLFDFAA